MHGLIGECFVKEMEMGWIGRKESLPLDEAGSGEKGKYSNACTH